MKLKRIQSVGSDWTRFLMGSTRLVGGWMVWSVSRLVGCWVVGLSGWFVDWFVGWLDGFCVGYNLVPMLFCQEIVLVSRLVYQHLVVVCLCVCFDSFCFVLLYCRFTIPNVCLRRLLIFSNVVDVVSWSYFYTLGKTNKEFNLRHDWNSLLSDDETLRMTRYTKEFFPHADVLVGTSRCCTCRVETTV